MELGFIMVLVSEQSPSCNLCLHFGEVSHSQFSQVLAAKEMEAPIIRMEVTSRLVVLWDT